MGSAFYMTDFRHLDHIISGVFIEPHLHIRSQKEWAMTNADVLCHAGGGITVYRSYVPSSKFANGHAVLDIGGPVHDYAQVSA